MTNTKSSSIKEMVERSDVLLVTGLAWILSFCYEEENGIPFLKIGHSDDNNPWIEYQLHNLEILDGRTISGSLYDKKNNKEIASKAHVICYVCRPIDKV